MKKEKCKFEKEYHYIKWDTLDKEAFKKECERLKNYPGATMQRLRTEKEQDFVDFIFETCYKGNTARCLLEKKLGSILTLDRKKDDKILIDFFGSRDNAITIVNECSDKCGELIKNAFVANKSKIENWSKLNDYTIL